MNHQYGVIADGPDQMYGTRKLMFPWSELPMRDEEMFFAQLKLLCSVSPCHWLFLILAVPALYRAQPSGAQVPRTPHCGYGRRFCSGTLARLPCGRAGA